MGDTGPRDSLKARGHKDVGLDLWIYFFLGFYSEELLLVSVFIGTMFHMNHPFASEKNALREVFKRRILEIFSPTEILLPNIFMGSDVWVQQLQKQISIYKSN